MNVKLITGLNAQELESNIAAWLEQVKQEANTLVAGTNIHLTSRAIIDFITIHQLFQTMQIVLNSNVVAMDARQQQGTYMLCVFIFYTLK